MADVELICPRCGEQFFMPPDEEDERDPGYMVNPCDPCSEEIAAEEDE